ncbi:MAG TPA: hypothetical protein VLU25_08100 [Acidobacteriota bacterium]|nr:hypothetical protein [Acidobacteriota bacterium]
MKQKTLILLVSGFLLWAGCLPKRPQVSLPPSLPEAPEEVDGGIDVPQEVTPPPPDSSSALPPLQIDPQVDGQPPRPWECESNLGETLVTAADRLLQERRYGSAITCFEEALAGGHAQNPQEVRLNLAYSYALAGLPVNAERELRRVAAGNDDFALQAEVVLAMYERLTQRSQQEIQRLENALKKLIDATGRPPR